MHCRKKAKREPEKDELYLGPEDRQRLEALTEIEREEILYERYLQKIGEKERKHLEQMVKMKEQENEHSEESGKEDRERAMPRIPSSKTTYDVFRHIVLPRNILLKIVYRRTIEKIKGYYVKIRLPSGYCVYKILKVTEGKRYEIGGIVTNKWLHIGRKKDKKEINIQSVSSTPLLEEEYLEYARDNILPGDREGIKMWKKMALEVETDQTEEELGYAISQRRRFLKYGKVAARRKIELRMLLEKAREENNPELAESLERELQEIQEM